ncbi:MAG: GNAT family N-acetyltransferase [Halobacteriaceae archaeon]
MEIRDATPDDAEAVRTVARESMTASYAPDVDEGVIESAVDRWYSAESTESALADPDTVFLVVEDDGVVAFAKGALVDRRDPTGEIHWLHVHPDRRGEGLGRRLLAETERVFAERGAVRLAGYVLGVNEVGASFYEENGYELAGERRIQVGDRTFEEREYEKFADTDAETEIPLEPVTEGGETFYVDFDDAQQGGSAEFYPVYRTEEGEQRYGWYCGGCESMDIVMDTMDRVECNDCGNRSKPSRWDAAYL